MQRNSPQTGNDFSVFPNYYYLSFLIPPPFELNKVYVAASPRDIFLFNLKNVHACQNFHVAIVRGNNLFITGESRIYYAKYLNIYFSINIFYLAFIRFLTCGPS